GIAEGVLRKPGALDREEWKVMRNHPLIGAQVVAPFDFFTGGALMIRHHHERWDGSGYPDGLAGDEIPLGARIIAVADVYDALTSNRPYRAALSHASALEHLTSAAGLTLDEDAVGVFVGLIEALSTTKPDVDARSVLRPSRCAPPRRHPTGAARGAGRRRRGGRWAGRARGAAALRRTRRRRDGRARRTARHRAGLVARRRRVMRRGGRARRSGRRRLATRRP